MAGSNYYVLQQCGTATTDSGCSNTIRAIGEVFFSTPGVCWEIISTDIGPACNLDIDAMIQATDCLDSNCTLISPTPTLTQTETPTPTQTPTNGLGIYIVTGFTSNTFASVPCPSYTDEQDTYDFTLYDEGGNLTTLGFNVEILLSGTSSVNPFGYSAITTIASGTSSGSTMVYAVENTGLPTCPGTDTIGINTIAVETAVSGYKFFLSAAIPGPQPTPSPTQTPTNTDTPAATPTSTPAGDNCACYSYINDGDPGGVNTTTYLDCSYNPQSLINVPFGGTGYFCAIVGSISPGVGITETQVDESFCGGCIEVLTPTPTANVTPTPTPTLPSISFPHGMCASGSTSCYEVCGCVGTAFTIYTTGSTINNGDHFYLDSGLTIDAPYAYYSDGTNCYEYLCGTNGIDTAYLCGITTCSSLPTQTPTPTPTQTSSSTPPSSTPTQTPTSQCIGCVGSGWVPYDNDECYRVNITGATAPVSPISLAQHDLGVYSSYGTQFFATGFNTDGTGTVQVTLDTPTAGGTYTGTTWGNPASLTTQGPMNRCALWTNPFSSTPTNTWIGFSSCLSGITSEKTYYVGIAADNEYKLILDGVEVLNTYGNAWVDEQFKWWHVYPINIGAGDHTLELYGLNLGSDAGFGCEIYDNTLADLTGFTAYSQINVIYTSSGETQATIVQDLSGNYSSSGYTCPSGYVYSICSGNCIQYEFCSVSITPTPTQTPNETPTQTPTNLYYFYVIKKYDCDNSCAYVSPDLVGRSSTALSTVDGMYRKIGSFVYQVQSQISPTTYDVDLDGTTNTDLDCITACSLPTSTPTETPTQTPTQTPAVTSTPTETPAVTSTSTPTQTPTYTETPTQTPNPSPTETPTNTPTQTMTQNFLYGFADCITLEEFRFEDVTSSLIVGNTYLITGSTEYEGCATCISPGSGPIYQGLGVTFTQMSGCGDDICPRVSSKAALLVNCSTEAIFYANVDEDTAYVGAVYEYNNGCYRFEEFSGPGGPDLGAPDWGDCVSCLNNTPTPTPYSTPTVTPTVSSTPLPCDSGDFCFTTTLSSLSDYNGQYTSGSTYNGRLTYSGGSISTGVIYYYTSATESYWCLSATLGGVCLLKGSNPCYSACPDISFGSFESGVCPTPTPTPIDCNTFDFNAYFDCDWEPVPTPSPSVDCDDVNFQVTSIPLTPTPTPSGVFCLGKAVSFVINEIPTASPTPTTTPTVTLTKTVDASGRVTFNIFEESFSCVSVKVLNKCGTDIFYYTSDPLVYNNTPIGVGMVMLAVVNNEIICVKYERDDSNLSSNSNVDEVLSIYGVECSSCSDLPTPTPTQTPTQTGTPSVSITPTQTQSPTQTPTTTQTPTSTPPPGLTPSATPRVTYSQTPTPTYTPTSTPSQTPTHTQTPTPSVTPNWKYVYSSCSAISPNVYPTYLIQTSQSPIQPIVGNQFKDSQGNCWTYEGRFEPNYIAPPLTVTQTFSGDYFAGQPPITYTACTDCQTIVTPPCTEIYFQATVCETNDTVVVRACDLGPCTTINFGLTTGEFCVTPQVGMTVGVYNSQGGDDICVVLDSIVSAQPSTLYVSTPAYAGFTFCSCPLYRVYKGNSCDGLRVDVAVYDLISKPIIPNDKVVGTDIGCFTITEYVGIKNVYPFLPGLSALVNADPVNDCPTCLNPVGTINCLVDGECLQVALTSGASTCADLGYSDC